ncbi:hypothetical protein UK23_15430 [Lentzea aerocolonigenes]|uniref:Uncharacterized protein n=1 Tax=Lentzea aerocolonigenes TaxID=68170 RepID=A0A0F0H3R6_LENAE|nr:hypothetical protein [Lentzea aerocolonigenes]KJK48917.1 hypothetical protein UK23_15430 [Lentzea aerocolonigenes]
MYEWLVVASESCGLLHEAVAQVSAITSRSIDNNVELLLIAAYLLACHAIGHRVLDEREEVAMLSNAVTVGLLAAAITGVCSLLRFAIAMRKTAPADRPDIIRALNEGTASGAIGQQVRRRSTRRRARADDAGTD